MNKRYLVAVLLLFIGLDTAYTFWQDYQQPLDGDLPAIMLPSEHYRPVLQDPFGWTVLTHHAPQAASNRFFAHATTSAYWKLVPRLLQHLWVSPIDSLYVASALFSTALQVALLLVLAAYIRQAVGGQPARWTFWVAVALLVPLFQTGVGFYEQMGIINSAITYTFFYPFPLLLVLGLLWPFYAAALAGQPLRLPWWRVLLLLLLMVVVAFNSPVAPATCAVLLLGAGIYWLVGQARSQGPRTLAVGWLSGQALGLLAALAALCLYSLYLGSFNTENDHSHTLAELYALLLPGAARYFSFQLGLPLLLLALVVNTGLVLWAAPPSPTRQRVLQLLGGVGLFGLCYLLLLPLGGYRSYRPDLLRNDSVLPVLLGLLFSYGLSAYFLLFALRGRGRVAYLGAVCLFGGYYLQTEYGAVLQNDNSYERWNFDQLARARGPVVELSPYGSVLNWGPMFAPHDSEVQAEVLYYWHVTPSKKLYYQRVK